MGGDVGPVTTISSTPVAIGSEKSTCWRRSSVIVRLAAAMSPRPCHQPGEQLVPAHRDEDHVHPEVPGLQPAVEVILEGPHEVVGGAALAAPVEEVEGLAVDDEDADPPLRDHLVQVARRPLLQGAQDVGRLGGAGGERCPGEDEEEKRRDRQRSPAGLRGGAAWGTPRRGRRGQRAALRDGTRGQLAPGGESRGHHGSTIPDGCAEPTHIALRSSPAGPGQPLIAPAVMPFTNHSDRKR